ncbi:MAG: DUF2490 domain-containing protein [Bryobacteraceae bacterium]
MFPVCRLLALAGLLGLLAPVLRAEDMQMWHWWTNEIGINKKAFVIVHSQFRTKRPIGEFLQGRWGPILMYSPKPRLYLVGGYYYRREPAPRQPGTGDSHRYFGGMQNYFYLGGDEKPKYFLESRILLERFQGGPEGTLTDYTRLRYRSRISLYGKKVSPLLGYEVFAWRNGLWANRPHAGIRWIPSPRVMLDIGYYWDGRRPGAGTPRHLIFTNLLLKLRKVEDPDVPNRPTF